MDPNSSAGRRVDEEHHAGNYSSEPAKPLYDYDEEMRSLYEPHRRNPSDYVEIALLSLFILFGIPITTYCFYKSLRTYFHQKGKNKQEALGRFFFLKLHLNMADMLIVYVYAVSELIWLSTFSWMGGNLLCKGVKFFHLLSFYLTSNVVVCIALDRTYNTFRIHRLHNKLKAWSLTKWMLRSAWLIAFIASVPQLFMWQTFQPYPPPNSEWTQCSTVWAINQRSFILAYKGIISRNLTNEDVFHLIKLVKIERIYSAAHIALAFWIPAAIIVVCYALIIWKLQRSITKTKNTFGVTTCADYSPSMYGTPNPQNTMPPLSEAAAGGVYSTPLQEITGCEPPVIMDENHSTTLTAKEGWNDDLDHRHGLGKSIETHIGMGNNGDNEFLSPNSLLRPPHRPHSATSTSSPALYDKRNTIDTVLGIQTDTEQQSKQPLLTNGSKMQGEGEGGKGGSSYQGRPSMISDSIEMAGFYMAAYGLPNIDKLAHKRNVQKSNQYQKKMGDGRFYWTPFGSKLTDNNKSTTSRDNHNPHLLSTASCSSSTMNKLFGQGGGPGDNNNNNNNNKSETGRHHSYAAATLVRAKNKTLRKSAFILLAYIICWSPYNILTLWKMVDSHTYGIVFEHFLGQKMEFLYNLIVINAILNPLIYGFR